MNHKTFQLVPYDSFYIYCKWLIINRHAISLTQKITRRNSMRSLMINDWLNIKKRNKKWIIKIKILFKICLKLSWTTKCIYVFSNQTNCPVILTNITFK